MDLGGRPPLVLAAPLPAAFDSPTACVLASSIVGRSGPRARTPSRRTLVPTLRLTLSASGRQRPAPALTSGRGRVLRLGRSWRQVAKAGDFDGGDDDFEFDAEDADLEEDVEIEERSEEPDPATILSFLESSAVIDTTLSSTAADAAHTNDPHAATAEDVTIPGAAMPEGFEIDEEQYHRIALFSCDFYFRKALIDGAGDDLYDFSQIYVTAPGGSTFSTPTIHCSLPKEPLRCTLTSWAFITGKTMPYSTDPYHAQAKEISEVTKVFMTKHLNNASASSPEFVLDFEEIYVLDGQEKSIKRANIQLEVPAGDRNRRDDVLIVRDNGNTFRIVQKEMRPTPDEVLQEFQWRQSRESVEDYLRGFRDFEKSNWF